MRLEPVDLRVAVLLATYNESGSIPGVITAIASSAQELKKDNIDLRVLLFDDQSPDHTAALAADVASKHGLALELHPGVRMGLGRAYLRAFAEVSRRPELDLVVTMDADGQHDGRVIATLVRRLIDQDLDLLIGSRWTKGGHVPGLTPFRRVLSRIGNLAFRTVTGVTSVRDASNSFRVSKRRVVENFEPSGLSLDGYSIMTSFVASAVVAGFLVAEHPITFHPRTEGESKLQTRDVVEFARNLVNLRRKIRSLAKRQPALGPSEEWVDNQ
ncbi:MAG: glycosyltransferase [Acidimicrobiia bacterium]